MKRILVIRFSSMGDVLLTAPVIRGAVERNENIEFFLLTKMSFAGYFRSINRLNIIQADTNGVHKGLYGIIKLARLIRREIKPDLIIDLHGVLRSRLLCFLSGMATPVFRIDKGRKEKRDYISSVSRQVLMHTVERYHKVFIDASIDVSIVNQPFNPSLSSRQTENKASGGTRYRIGLAPFSRHQAKTWPLANSIELMRILARELNATFHIYGSRDDREILLQHDLTDIQTENLAGALSPSEEIESIGSMDIFVSMDSANMHLADLTGIKVISIWGGTHPDLGFRPFNQPGDYAVQTSEILPCQPCSVYGNKKCILKESEYKCLTSISPLSVAQKILQSI